MFGLGGGVFAEEFGSSKFNKVVITIHNMWRAGKFNSGKIVADSKGDFLSEETSVRGYDAGAKDAVISIRNKFDKAIIKIIGFAGSDFV